MSIIKNKSKSRGEKKQRGRKETNQNHRVTAGCGRERSSTVQARANRTQSHKVDSIGTELTVLHLCSATTANAKAMTSKTKTAVSKIFDAITMEFIFTHATDLDLEGKASPTQDILSRMLLMVDEDGKFMKESDIADKILGLLIGGHDTASSACAFIVKYLAELPHIYQGVYKDMYVLLNLTFSGASKCNSQKLIMPFWN
ncbi:hypothetical protein CsSME_00049017 [Camellia sinensis var. sinensis]|uniref:Cytochrome P450 n=1 Tax=Camellia sinensis TaxID=4442 RepID=A0A7J7GA54_CAMSI|nr:hypothetical protein HYC85_027363 [Camellia sinensis]